MAELEEEPGLRGRFMFRMAMMEMIITSSAAAAAMPSILAAGLSCPAFAQLVPFRARHLAAGGRQGGQQLAGA